MNTSKFSLLVMVMNMSIFYCLSLGTKEDDLVTELPDEYPYDYMKYKMYSGYLTPKTETKKLHYVLVESQSSTPEKDPLLLWLNGGPGCSSLLGLADENGPTYFEEFSTKQNINQYSWNKLANVIYLEMPAGVGFSTANNPEDLITDDDKSANDNLEALLDFFNRFPEYVTRDFYISGESYAGIYVPYLAATILNYNLSASTKINLKGIIIGNGATDWKYDTTPAMIDFAWDHNLYSQSLRNEIVKYNCKFNLDHPICSNLVSKALSAFDDGVNVYDIYRNCFPPNKRYTPWLSNKHIQRNLKTSDLKVIPPCADAVGSLYWYNLQQVKKAFHVDESIKWDMCSDALQYNRDDSIGSYHLYESNIFFRNNLKVWIYSGDTDAAVPINGTRKWLLNLKKALKLKTSEEWRQWKNPKGEVAGYTEEYSKIRLVTIKGTGHMVPQWKREEAFIMLDAFLNGKNL